MIDSPTLPLRSTQDNVVHLDNGSWAQGNDDFPACAELLQYWQELRGTRQMPVRSKFYPLEIETSLASILVAEKVAPSVARIRLAGSILNNTLGMDVRGMPLTALFEPTVRDSIAEATRDLFASPAIVVLELNARCGFSRRPVRARLLLLPMSDTDGNIAPIVGCLDIKGGIGKSPRRFKVSSIRRTDVTGDAPQPTQVEPLYSTAMQRKQLTETYSFAENTPIFKSKRQSEKPPEVSRGSLRLVVSNE